MQKRAVSLMLCAVLIFAMIPAVRADAPAYTDISGHWAASYIQRVSELGLFQGVTETTFAPEQTMTRGMFVTVLGRLAGVDPEQWRDSAALFQDVGAGRYYAPYINWAVYNGITNGTGTGTFSPDANVTRQEMATFAANFVRLLGYQLNPVTDTPYIGDFSDESSISGWARDAVDLLQVTGIINGIRNEDGSFRFAPRANATRAECSAILSRLYDALEKLPEEYIILPTGVRITSSVTELSYGQSAELTAEAEPVGTTNSTLTWSSSNPNVISVSLNGVAVWKSVGSAVLTVSTCNGFTASVTVTALPAPNLAYAGESYAEKCARIFGETVDDPRLVYASQEEAAAQMTTITVKVWDYNSSGTKVTKTFSLTVHKNIADTVQQIFAEIYALPSRPPIRDLGGYRWAGKSEHSPGLAIDINANENYYCDPDGNALVGSFFDPDRSEYSIPVDGEVQRIFEKYGFTRGIYWRSGYKDYMHFSFFGT